ncbi:MAG: hypothetical protein ABJC39_05785 [Chloroflexota bacterium]
MTLLLTVIGAAAIIAGCSSAGSPSTRSPSPSPSTAHTTSAPSQAPGQSPDTSVGSDLPVASDGLGIVDPDSPLVTPKPGQLDVHPISAQRLTAGVVGRKVTVTVAYSSGVEPCSILDSIVVAVGAEARTFGITLREGHGPGDVACIEIAQRKRTVVDLPELAAGIYTISDATGGAAPIEVTVS